MTDEKLFIISKKLMSFFPSGETFYKFTDQFKNLYSKQNQFFSFFDEESFFKLFVFIYQLTQKDSNFDLNYLILKTAETKIVLTFYTSYSEVLDICSECDGDGVVNCDYCDGKGEYECSDCDGYREIDGEPCFTCQGGGEVVCDYCEETGTTSCDNCDGTGEEDNWQQKKIEVYWEISDDTQINSELNNYEDTTSPLPQELDEHLKKLREYEVMVETENVLQFEKDEKFVKQIFNRPKNKGMILRGMISDSEFPTGLYFSDM